MTNAFYRVAVGVAVSAALFVTTPVEAQKQRAPTQKEAKQFVEKVNEDLKRLWTKAATAEWIKATYITPDTQRNAAWANEEVMEYTTRAIKESMRFSKLKLDEDTARQLKLLRVGQTLPSPSDAGKRGRLAQLASELEGLYGKGQWCGELDAEGNIKSSSTKKCRDLGQLSDIIANSRDYDELLDAWVGWRTVARPMRPKFQELAALSNEGAREIGFKDTGVLWRSGYDMSPVDFEKETDRLWQQVKPLYDDLHCYVRSKLADHYGEDKVPAGEPIPAHLLGNMWAQEWPNIYELVEPYPGQASLDVDSALKRKRYFPVRMVKLGEHFFTSLGLDKLPKTFWESSQFVKPRDRDVVCHASAWDVNFEGDLRIKMCIKPTEEELVTIHHELGHNYYFMYYNHLPVLYQGGANDGFHEAIGDAITLSITPQYLQRVNLLGEVKRDEKNLINLQLKDALEKIAFLPFGKLIDQWRWDVYSGKIEPSEYNEAWWKLREEYQGVAAPVARTEEDFDPGAKYHIPSNVPYTRYFLARILQFQFHKAMCETIGHEGPLHECSIYGNKEAGSRLKAMLSLGASKPWPEALHAMTGQRKLDATPVLDYFQPLQGWLKEQNAGKQCGW